MESLHTGIFNAWTEKSLSRLAELMPGRYAKSEMSSGFIGAIDRYVYRSPLAQAAALAASNTGTTPAGSNTTPGNGNTAPSNNGAAPGNNGATPSNNGAAPGNKGATPSNPEQTTHPALVGANDGGVKNANPH